MCADVFRLSPHQQAPVTLPGTVGVLANWLGRSHGWQRKSVTTAFTVRSQALDQKANRRPAPRQPFVLPERGPRCAGATVNCRCGGHRRDRAVGVVYQSDGQAVYAHRERYALSATADLSGIGDPAFSPARRRHRPHHALISTSALFAAEKASRLSAATAACHLNVGERTSVVPIPIEVDCPGTYTTSGVSP